MEIVHFISFHVAATFEMLTDQVVAVGPLEVFLHRAVVQPDPGVVVAET